MNGVQQLKNVLRGGAVLLACSVGAVLANDCQIQISQSVVDHGNLNPSTLRASAKSSSTAALDKRVMQLNVLCTDVKDMAVTFRGLASGPESYQISDKGEFDLTLKDARLDGNPVLLGLVNRAGEIPAESGPSVKLTPSHYVVPVVDHQVKVGKVLSIKVELNARLFVEGLKVRDIAPLEGLGQFELN